MSVPVEFSARFLRALDAMALHYAEMRHTHPDAGAALDEFLAALEHEALPLLLEQPGLGAPVSLETDGFDDSAEEVLRIAHAARRTHIVARQWRVGEFWLLYAERGGQLTLISARHQRQRRYP
jgi:hypothetical protein